MNYVRAVPEKYTREGRKAPNYVRAVPEKYTREGRKAPNYARAVPEEYFCAPLHEQPVVPFFTSLHQFIRHLCKTDKSPFFPSLHFGRGQYARCKTISLIGVA
jgi:hypothetical protein